MSLKDWIIEELENNEYDNNRTYNKYDTYSKLFDDGYFDNRKKVSRSSFERIVRDTNVYLQDKNNITVRSEKPKNLPDDIDDSLKTITEEDGTIRLIGSSKQIRTKQDLIDEAEINIDDYIELSHKANTWNSFYKIGDGSKGATLVQLFQQELKLKPKVIPESMLPPIQPIQVDFNYTNPTVIKKDGIEKVIIMADAQIGYLRSFEDNTLEPMQCENSLSLALKICKEEQPDKIILAGDMLDLTESSSYEQKKEFIETTQPAINRLGKFLVNLREACPNSYIAFQEGNHSARLKKAINNNVSWALNLKPYGSEYEIFDLRFLLQTDKLGIEVFSNYPNNAVWLNDNLKVIHGNIARNGVGATSKAHLEKNMVSVISAHVHKMELLTKTYEDRYGLYNVTSCTIGCLCRNDGTVPSKNGGSENWQNGICKVQLFDNHFQIDNISFTDNKAIVDGKLYTID
jgi:hypothetical protein